MAKYKVVSPLYVTSQKKLFKPGDIVDLAGSDEEVALYYHAVIPDLAAQARSSVKAEPTVTSAAQKATSTLNKAIPSTVSNTPAKPGEPK